MSNKSLAPLPLERIIACLSYLTMGLVGFIWLLLGAFLKLGLRQFLKYHIYQSIFISFGLGLLAFALSLILGILSAIPFLGTLIAHINFWLETPIFAGYSTFNILFIFLILYLSLTSLAGLYSFIPWVSNIIKNVISHEAQQ